MSKPKNMEFRIRCTQCGWSSRYFSIHYDLDNPSKVKRWLIVKFLLTLNVLHHFGPTHQSWEWANH